MIIFYRIPSESPNIRKISLMLAETGLPYVVKMIDAHDSDSVNTEFQRISPNGTVPAILDTDTGISLFESAAILQYLAEKTGLLLSDDQATRAITQQWLLFEAANVCPAMIELHHYILHDDGETPQSIFERYKTQLTRYCTILDQQLSNREYLAGDYSIADIVLYPWGAALEDMAEINLKDFPHLHAWIQSIDGRPAAQQSLQQDPSLSHWCFHKGNVQLCGHA